MNKYIGMGFTKQTVEMFKVNALSIVFIHSLAYNVELLQRAPTLVYLPSKGYSNRLLTSTDSDCARKSACYLTFSDGESSIDEWAAVIIGDRNSAQHMG